jgi:hypothetical protein
MDLFTLAKLLVRSSKNDVYFLFNHDLSRNPGWETLVYILIVHNFINQLLRKLKTESCMEIRKPKSLHPDNREYTVLIIRKCI